MVTRWGPIMHPGSGSKVTIINKGNKFQLFIQSKNEYGENEAINVWIFYCSVVVY